MKSYWVLTLMLVLISCREASNGGNGKPKEESLSEQSVEDQKETKMMYETGELHSIQIHSNNEVVYETTYYRNGAKMTEGAKKNGKKDGVWVSYDSLGNLSMRMMNREGITIGIFEQFHPNGNIAIRGEDIGGNGLFEFYDTLGNLEMRNMYKNSRPIDTLFWNEWN